MTDSVGYPLTTFFVTVAVAIIAYHARDFWYLHKGGKLRLAHMFGALSFFLSLSFNILTLVFFQTVNISLIMCKLSVLTCATLYASTKLTTYLFLIERVHLVTAMKMSHKNDKIFIRNVSLLTPYGVILILMLMYVVSYYGEAITYGDAQDCYIGLEKPASIPLVVYDTFFSFQITLQFLKPLKESIHKSEKIKATAKKNMIGSVVALFSSMFNIMSLVLFPSTRALVCLSFCVWDVTISAMVIYYMALGNVVGRFTSRPTVVASTHNSYIVVQQNERVISQKGCKINEKQALNPIHENEIQQLEHAPRDMTAKDI